MRRQIVPFDQQDLQSPARCIARNSDAVYAAANDGQIIHRDSHRETSDSRNVASQYTASWIAFSCLFYASL